MKVSLNWLRDYVELPSEVSALCELLTQAGVEVEGVETSGVTMDHVVAARIESFEPHPNADRLRVCRVNDGGEALRQIVCGAKNFRAGDIVPLAQPGAVLPGNFEIKVGKLRGVESQGMLCAAEELGLADSAEGLLILPPETAIGTSLRELFPSDTILDVEVTPNRSDLLSHVGMAREIAALSAKVLRSPEISGGEASAGWSVTLEATEACPLYRATTIEGVRVGPSPAWLRQKLEAVGLRAINNIVDVTNFVMLELGQPLHAFDAARVRGGIVVRMATAGERLKALDGRVYELTAEDLVIADENSALALAGVMGGEESGTTETTQTVILESAWFAPAGIRRTSRRLGLSSDSSYRFEREVDPAGVEKAARRAAQLIVGIAGGSVVGLTESGTMEQGGRVVRLRTGRCSEVAGGEIPEDRAEAILRGLGLAKTQEGWKVPSHRPDLLREIDLVEEVVRVFGIENIPPRLTGRYVESSKADATHDQCMAIRQVLAATGFYECRTVSLVSTREAEENPIATPELLPLRNPMSEDQTILRPDLLPGLLRVLAHNLRAGEKSVRLFEVGRVFRASREEETLHLGLIMTGASLPPGWREKDPRSVDFHDLKGVLASLGLAELQFLPLEPAAALPLAAEIKALGRAVGRIGQLAPGRARGLDATAPVLVAELDLGQMLSPKSRRRKFREIVRFPAVTRDIALFAPVSVGHDVIEKAVKSAKESLLESVALFDVFQDPTGVKVPVGKRSLAYSLTYRANDRTLTADEVTQAHGRIKERLRAIADVTFRE